MLDDLKGKKVLVVGFGLSGVAVAKYMAKQGAKVTVTDLKQKIVPGMEDDQRAAIGALGGALFAPITTVHPAMTHPRDPFLPWITTAPHTWRSTPPLVSSTDGVRRRSARCAAHRRRPGPRSGASSAVRGTALWA